jgi:hypothetical protein
MRVRMIWTPRLRLTLRWLFSRCRPVESHGRIFISYRWDDTEASVGRIQDHLEAHFGDPAVFRDIKIESGEDFREVISLELGTCYAVLVAIGRRWLAVVDHSGRRRIDDPDDLLRREVEYALEHDARLRVIPVLVEGAQMPPARELPEAIERLAYRKAAVLSNENWREDMQKLILRLQRPRPDRFGRWSDIRPQSFPVAPLIVNALLRPYWPNLVVPFGLVVAGLMWVPWLWLVAAVLYVALVVTTLFDLQQARCVREVIGEEERDDDAAAGIRSA